MEKVAIVTAGSKGIGLACASRLASDGFKVGILSRSELVEEAASELKGLGVRGSVTSSTDLEQFVRACMSKWKRIDVVVNNTGHVSKGELLEISDEEWVEGFNMLFLNVVRITRLVTPIMQSQSGGSFINISSFAAFEPSLRFPVSSAIRTSLASYSRLFTNRYAVENIRMNNVLPGFVDSYPVDDRIREEIPAGKQGTTQDIAALVSYLASEDSQYVSGESIRIDGGLSKSI